MCVLTTYLLVVSIISTKSWAQTFVVADAIRTPTARLALKRAAQAALDRLDRAECRRVLSEFRDVSGHTIQENLDVLGESPRSYLASIVFREASDRQCRNPNVLAVTTIGGREVFICSRQFWEVYRRNPAHVEALLIHEMMHSLGLGENPPSSAEITERVVQYCW